jgi:hypothetical protein
MLWETEVTEALIGLNNAEPCTSIEVDNASVFFYGDEAVHYSDLKVVGNYVEVPLFEAERIFGSTIVSSSTYTPSDAPSDESQEQLSETLPGGSGTLSEKESVTKRNAKSGIWKFFEIHEGPEMKDLAFCLLCKKDINYTFTMGTGMLT